MKPVPLPKIPPAPRAQRQTMTKMEQFYMKVLMHWYRHTERAPSCEELRGICRPVKSPTAVRSALLALESKGYVQRNAEGRFELVTP